MPKKTKATVAAIITKQGSFGEKLLLTKRGVDPFKGQWCLPGGHIDRFESARNAIYREVKEETGLDYKSRFFNAFDEIIPEMDIHAVVLAYHGQGIGKVIEKNDEVESSNWFSFDEALSLPMAFQHRDILKAYLCKNTTGNEYPSKSSSVLEEHSALRSEILKRIELRQQTLTFALLAAGTLLTIVFMSNEPKFEILLIFPILAMFLSLLWMQSDLRIGEIGEYIRNNLKLGWETHVREKHKDQRIRPVEFAAYGIFMLTSIMLGVLWGFEM